MSLNETLAHFILSQHLLLRGHELYSAQVDFSTHPSWLQKAEVRISSGVSGKWDMYIGNEDFQQSKQQAGRQEISVMFFFPEFTGSDRVQPSTTLKYRKGMKTVNS